MPRLGVPNLATQCHVDDGPGTACAALARLLGGRPDGTAPVMTSWLMIEQPGPWPRDALETVLGQAFSPERLAQARAIGLRPLLIRRPGRHQRSHGPRTVFVGSGVPGARWLERLEITDPADLAALDLEAVSLGRPGHGEPFSGPLFGVCTHGTKDMCCAVFGRPVAAALAAAYPDRTWEVSHVGGDRWAANLLVVPDGFLHGQLTPDDAGVIAALAMDGQVHPDHLRGRTSAATPWEQSAEIAVRRHAGLRELDAVTVLARGARCGSLRTLMLRGGGTDYEVTIRHREGDELRPSRCPATSPLSDYSVEALRPAH